MVFLPSSHFSPLPTPPSIIPQPNAAVTLTDTSAALAGLEGKVTLIHGKVEEVVLPVDKVDIIVSEWMVRGVYPR